jgi:Fe-S oxidoreductase
MVLSNDRHAFHPLFCGRAVSARRHQHGRNFGTPRPHVVCPEEIACCGQPPFNSGYWAEARNIATPVLEKLADAEAVVIGSGSCGAMVKNFYPELFKETATRSSPNKSPRAPGNFPIFSSASWA